jgi:hypothetical protein
MPITQVRNVIPHVPSTDPQITRDFFTEVFGFEILYETADYIELGAGNCLVGVLRAQGQPNQQSIYIRVNAIDALWQRRREVLSLYKHRELFVQDYGMKEFHVVAPETRTLIFVGEEVAQSDES